MKKQFNLDLNALKACIYSMSNEETRYYLMGVHIFERDGSVFYESTNGHMLVRVESELQNDEFDYIGLNITLPSFLCKELSKASIRKGFGVHDMVYVPCDVDETRINIEMIDGIINYKLIDGTYLDTDKVIPKEGNNPKVDFGIDTKYMANFHKSLKAIGCSGLVNMTFTGEGEGNPILVKDRSITNWTGVIMPLRV